MQRPQREICGDFVARGFAFKTCKQENVICSQLVLVPDANYVFP